MEIDTEKLRLFFFKAMLHGGWLVGKYISSIDELPGYEMYGIIVGELRLIDMWTAEGGWSTGSTNIFLREKPVWTMHYGGWYDERAIPLVKKAIIGTYQDMVFAGGRGTDTADKLSYHNVWIGDFTEFSGKETVEAASLHPLGYHKYGGHLIKPPGG